jgi:hypothetical protein
VKRAHRSVWIASRHGHNSFRRCDGRYMVVLVGAIAEQAEGELPSTSMPSMSLIAGLQEFWPAIARMAVRVPHLTERPVRTPYL